MDRIRSIEFRSWEQTPHKKIQEESLNALESGEIVFFPELNFKISRDEQPLLDPQLILTKRKNISYDPPSGLIRGHSSPQHTEGLQKLLCRYYQHSLALIYSLFPLYQNKLSSGRTSLRTVAISARKRSCLKDDTLLHVDSFVATPVNGQRILRVFTNINPDGVARVWQVGESFSTVARRFLPQIPSMTSLEQYWVHLLKITKTLRSPYDHFMLNIHNAMKKDKLYQQEVQKTTIELPAGSSWIVYSDQVSHAAISGQHVLEQSFYLPIQAMQDPQQSPLFILESLLNQKLTLRQHERLKQTEKTQ